MICVKIGVPPSKKKDKKIDSEVVPWGKCEKVSQNEKSVKKILKSWI